MKSSSTTSAQANAIDAEPLLDEYMNKPVEFLLEWQDPQSEARGYLAINSFRGGAAGGGTRMRKGLNKEEVISLAKTMEIKFSISGPAIGGAKSGIDFDPADPRKDEVLGRWFAVISPLLLSCYGTGGDLNLDEVKDIIPHLERLAIWHPQEGIVIGHYAESGAAKARKLTRLRTGVKHPVSDPTLTPVPHRYTIADLVTGYGVSESVRHYYDVWHKDTLKDKRVLVQGWGNVASAAAYYLSAAGAQVVGIMDIDAGILSPTTGLNYETIKQLFMQREQNRLSGSHLLAKKEVDERFWDIPADIFVPAAASRLITRAQTERLLAAGIQVISSGANVPFNEKESVYGEVMRFADQSMSLIPDFIASAAMARVFAYLMQGHAGVQFSETDVFADASACIRESLASLYKENPSAVMLARTAYAQAAKKLLLENNKT